MEPSLLEREHELTEVGALLERTISGRGGAVVIVAHAGLGKSALLQATVRSAAAMPPLRVAAFACDELERRFAWAAATELLSEALAGVTAAARRRVLGGAASSAAGMLEPNGPPGSEHSGTDELVRALFLVVSRLAERAPLALVLDDAHWCDEPSLRFLLYLQRRLSRLPVAIIAAVRPALDEAAGALHDHLVSSSGTIVLRPAPLGPAAIATLVRAGGFDEAKDEFCRACWAATAGNPLYVHELLTELRRTGASQAPGKIGPTSVARSVLARVNEIPHDGARECARAAAVLGDGALLRHVAALAGIPGDQAAAVADALAAQQVLAPGEPIRFIHPLVRSALYEAIPAAERARMHGRAAELLTADAAAAELIAVHLLHAPRAACATTVASLRAAAARTVARGGVREAAAYLRRALEEPPAPQERAQILIELSRAEAATGDPASAGHLREAVALIEEPRDRAEALLALGWVEHHAGRFAIAADTFERGLAIPTDEDLRASLEAGYLLSAFFDTGRSAQAQARIAKIAARVPQSHGPAQRALLAQVLFARTMRGDPHRELLALARHLWDDGRLLSQEGPDSQTLWNVIGTLSWEDDYATANAAISAALRDADARGSALAAARGHYARAWPRYWTGDLEGAASDAAAAIEIWDGGLETYLPAAVYWHVLALLELGRHEHAQRALLDAGPLERWEDTAFLGFLHAARGEIAMAGGQWKAALDDHLACGRIAEALHFRSPSIMAWRSRAALAASNAGDRDTAMRLAGEELALAEAGGAPRAYGVALRVCGLLGQGADALEMLERSVRVLEPTGAALESARSLVELGAGLRRSNQRAAARRQLRRGHQFAQRAGAAGLVRRAATELRAAGGRTARRDPLDAELTASERRVAELAAAGHSNPEIARMLHVSVKAIEWHLNQTYRKLDIKSRHQLPSVLTGD